jgi:hypothetical protein
MQSIPVREQAVKRPLRSVTTRAATVGLVLLCLGGCASTFTLPDNVLDISRSMTREEALAIIDDYVHPDSKHAGLCAHWFSQSLYGSPGLMAKVIRVSGAEIYYSGDVMFGTGSRVEGDFLAGTGQVYVSYTTAPRDLAIDLSQLAFIRLNNESDCGPEWHGKTLRLHVSRSQGVSVQIDDARFDRFAAALRFIAPQALWKQGWGF